MSNFKNNKGMKTSELFKTVKNNGRDAKVLGIYPINTMPRIVVFGGRNIELSMFENHLRNIPEGTSITFGRKGFGADFWIGQDNRYSRIHFAIVKIGEEMCQVIDCSLNGTEII